MYLQREARVSKTPKTTNALTTGSLSINSTLSRITFELLIDPRNANKRLTGVSNLDKLERELETVQVVQLKRKGKSEN